MSNLARDAHGVCQRCGATASELHKPGCLFHPQEDEDHDKPDHRCDGCGAYPGEYHERSCPVFVGLMRPKTVLEEADRIVDGPRQDSYGHPADNHGCTAELWNAYIARRFDAAPEAMLDAYDVCLLNILQKVSRLAHSRERDGLVDIAGFARNAEIVDE